MARSYSWRRRNYSTGGRKRRRKSGYTKQERFALLLGQVERGLKNPDSRISESHEKGLKPKERKPKKSLY